MSTMASLGFLFGFIHKMAYKENTNSNIFINVNN